MEAILALISAVVGGGIFKGFDWWLNKKKVNFDEDRAWRTEYRGQIEDLQQDIKVLKEELGDARSKEDEWRIHCEQMFWGFKQFQLQMYQVLLLNNIDPTDYIKEIQMPGERSKR
jgi:hypothetical protein